MIELDDRDAEALVLETMLSEYELLTLPVYGLVSRGLDLDYATPLRMRWVGSSKPISPRWVRAIGMASVESERELNRALGGHANLIAERLRLAGIRPGAASKLPAAQYRLAESVYSHSTQLDLKANAELHGIRVHEAALYRRHYARCHGELVAVGAAPEAAVGLWYEDWSVHPKALRRPWTASPPAYWRLLEGSRG